MFDNLSPEAREKAKACRSAEELLTLAKEEGYELSDDELEQVSGGASWMDCEANCPPNCRDVTDDSNNTGSD